MKLTPIQVAVGGGTPAPAVLATKDCTGCKRTLPEDAFSIKNRQTGRRNSRCKACQRSYAKSHYADNREQYIDRAALRNTRVKRAYQQDVDTHLSACACATCGTEGELFLYRKPGYTGLPTHEVIRRKGGIAAFQTALKNSDALCRSCLGANFAPNLLPYQFVAGGVRRYEAAN